MPFTKEDLENLPISFCGQDDVWVIVGPCSAKTWKEHKIPLDGRKYKTGGTIIFKNGQQFRASFFVDTTTFDFVHKASIYINIAEDWYCIEEPEMLTVLSLKQEDIYPLRWQSDRPLNYHLEGPYTLDS